MKLVDRFDEWAHQGPFSAADLGIYRIVYSLAALFTVPDISWVSNYPDFMFNAPPGPVMLLSNFPPLQMVIALEVLRTVTLVMLAVGVWTKWTSVAVWFMLTATYGVTFTVGKVDHTILFVAVPLVLAFSGWGDRFSIDALRRDNSQPSEEPRSQPQWPLRLLALLIAWAFFAAALTKLLTGWLAVSSQAARGYFVLGYVTQDRNHLLAQWMATHDYLPLWEIMDWMTVVFEFSLLLTLPWWRAFRLSLAVATTFHLGVLLVMNIDFSNAVIAYGAFVCWGAVPRRLGSGNTLHSLGRYLRSRRLSTLCLVFGLLGAAVGAIAWYLMVTSAGTVATGYIAGNLIIVVGALIGASYILLQCRDMLRLNKKHSSHSNGKRARQVGDRASVEDVKKAGAAGHSRGPA